MIAPGRVELRRGARGVDLRRQAEFRREVAGLAERHEQAAGLDELLELGDAFEPHAAGDVVRLAVHPEVLERLALLVFDRLAAPLDVEHDAACRCRPGSAGR